MGVKAYELSEDNYMLLGLNRAQMQFIYACVMHARISTLHSIFGYEVDGLAGAMIESDIDDTVYEHPVRDLAMSNLYSHS